MQGWGAARRGVMATAAVAFLLLPLSCTDDEPFDAARPLLPTAAPTSNPDGSEPQTDDDLGADGPVEPAPDDPVDDAAPDTRATEAGAAVDDSESDGATTADAADETADDEDPEAVEPAGSAPPTAASPSTNSASRPSGGTPNAGSGGGTTLSGPDLIAGLPPRPVAPTPQTTQPTPDVTNVPPTVVLPDAPPLPTVPPGGLPATCFGRTIDECTGEVIPEGAVTQMGEYQTNVHVPVGKGVDIYFDQARTIDEMVHLCDAMGGTIRQRAPDGSRWSGWWFCDDVVP